MVGVSDDKIKVPMGDAKFFDPRSGTRSSVGPKKKRVLIYFIGGITQAEIAALKFLQKTNPMYKRFKLGNHYTSIRIMTISQRFIIN